MTISSKQLGLLSKQLGLLSKQLGFSTKQLGLLNNSHKLSSLPSGNPLGQSCEEQGERSG